MGAIDENRKRALREFYETRCPDMGVVCWKIGRRMWVGMSRDIRATYNGTRFQLELGSWPNRDLQIAYSANPDAAEWAVLKQLDYVDRAQDHTDDLELLLMEVMDEHPEAQPLSKGRRFC